MAPSVRESLPQLESTPLNSGAVESMLIPTSTTSLAWTVNAFSYEVAVRSGFAFPNMRISVAG